MLLVPKDNVKNREVVSTYVHVRVSGRIMCVY